MYDKFPFFERFSIFVRNYGLQGTGYRNTHKTLKGLGIRSYPYGSGYDYELSYAVMMKKFEKELLQLSVGHVPKSKNSKKNFKPDLEK